MSFVYANACRAQGFGSGSIRSDELARRAVTLQSPCRFNVIQKEKGSSQRKRGAARVKSSSCIKTVRARAIEYGRGVLMFYLPSHSFSLLLTGDHGKAFTSARVVTSIGSSCARTVSSPRAAHSLGRLRCCRKRPSLSCVTFKRTLHTKTSPGSAAACQLAEACRCFRLFLIALRARSEHNGRFISSVLLFFC